MKIKLAISALIVSGATIMIPEAATAVVYCQYINYPPNCVVRPGVVLAPRPAVRAATPGAGAPGVGVRPGVGVGAPGPGVVGGPANRGGPVDRPGRR